MAQLVMGAVGAVAGFFIGGPTGALIGFNVGASIGASMEETTVQGNKIGDIARQTSKEGVARPIIWGRVRPIGGNLIACSEPNIVKTSHKSGGKGGGGVTTTTESVYRTYAVRVCEGPITNYVRIWRNNELVYDARGNDWGVENNPEFLKTARLYTGAWEQMPDSALEGIYGSGNVPAHRGTAYIVMNNELLDDTGGAVPQWIFEVERIEGIILTSKPYNVECLEELQSDNVSKIKESPNKTINDIIFSSGTDLHSISLNKTFFPVYNSESDNLISNGLTFQSCYLYASISLVTYSNDVESIMSNGSSVISVTMQKVKIDYQEKINSLNSYGISIIGVSLS